MENQHYTISFEVERTPKEVFDAINNVPGWWWGDVEGDTDKVGAEFTYRVPDVHYSKQKITDLTPNERIKWLVTDAELSFPKIKDEWKGTEMIFEITPKGDKTELKFTHTLAPDFECFDRCSNAWQMLVGGNLKKLILTGEKQPRPW